MKKIICTLLLLISSSAIAGGPYDGIWESEGDLGFFSLHERNGKVIITRMDNINYNNGRDFKWEAYYGRREGNRIHLDTIPLDFVFVRSFITVTMTSDSTFEAVMDSCTSASGYYCLVPDGYSFSGRKVW